MKSWIPLLILSAAAVLAFLAPIANANDGTDETVRMGAKLTGIGSMGGEVHYLESSGRIRIKAIVWDVKAPGAILMLDDHPVRLVQDMGRGTGYALLDSRDGSAFPMKEGSRIRVMLGRMTIMSGVLTRR